MSGRRNLIFIKREYYHIYNRTVGSEQVFTEKRNIERALDLISFYRFQQSLRFSFFNRLNDDIKGVYLEKISKNTPIVNLFAYALMPNHFHFLVEQNSENGIQKFLSDFQNSFAKYFNLKNSRSGTLFQRPFKAKHIDTDEEFLHISRYINLNPVTSCMMGIEELKKSSLTSFHDYVNLNEKSFVNIKFAIELSGSDINYKRFVENQVDYQRRLAGIKHLLLD